MKNKSIRSSQILSPFGIGQIVNFPQEVSLMICGLSQWDEKLAQRKEQVGEEGIDEHDLKIFEPRLQKMLNVEYFFKPFVYRETGSKNRDLTIPAVRFPRWHYCTNSKCGRMREVPLYSSDEQIDCFSCSDLSRNFKSKMIPVRFVAACANGHIQDVPFKEWVHDGLIPQDNIDHHLSYQSLSGSGDLGSIRIKCSCGEARTLAGLMNVRKNGNLVFDSALARIGLGNDESHSFTEEENNNENPNGQYCKGHRPWLGLEGVKEDEKCDQRHLQVLIRGGSNVHYSDIVSALYLPEASKLADESVVKFMENHGGKEKLKSLFDLDDGVMLRGLFSTESNLFIDQLIKEIKTDTDLGLKKYSNIDSEVGLRIEEYNYILAERDSENSAFKAIKKTFEDYIEDDFLKKYFDCVVLIEKLKETRVFRGFSRINPGNVVEMSELSDKPVTWLPAIEVYGEGIFLKFRDDMIDQWLEKHGESFSNIIGRYNDAIGKRRPNSDPRSLNASFILMHTFAHLLIKRLCFQCGYGSSSLRERLYFSDDSENRMNGILIYTSSGDSEGSLGGLVRQGKENNLGKIIKDAIEDARWCSADPVCSDIGQSSGQGPDNINGAACHNCCIIPETSCEEFNMLLDRATIAGSLENDIGFFNY